MPVIALGMIVPPTKPCVPHVEREAPSAEPQRTVRSGEPENVIRVFDRDEGAKEPFGIAGLALDEVRESIGENIIAVVESNQSRSREADGVPVREDVTANRLNPLERG